MWDRKACLLIPMRLNGSSVFSLSVSWCVHTEDLQAVPRNGLLVWHQLEVLQRTSHHRFKMLFCSCSSFSTCPVFSCPQLLSRNQAVLLRVWMISVTFPSVTVLSRGLLPQFSRVLLLLMVTVSGNTSLTCKGWDTPGVCLLLFTRCTPTTALCHGGISSLERTKVARLS